MQTPIPPSTQTKSDNQKEADNDLVISYLTLRNLIGFCGMLLPLILVLATSVAGPDVRLLPSLSDYYYTSTGEIFVVILSMLAVFLFTYQGYSPGEKIWSFFAGLGALGVAFFPTEAPLTARLAFSVHTPRRGDAIPQFFGLIEWHFVFAGLFFIAAAIVALVYFTRLKPGESEITDGKLTQKGKRNRVYRTSGWVMLTCVVGIAIYFSLRSDEQIANGFPVIFVLETIAVEAFGVAWLTKGHTLWPDGKPHVFKVLQRDKPGISRP